MCCMVLGQMRLEKAPSGLTDVSKLSLNHSSYRDKQRLSSSCYSEWPAMSLTASDMSE